MELTGTRRKLFTFRKALPAPQLHNAASHSRVTSIDLLRGVVMIIMALDHVRDFFHVDAFRFDPTDLTQTNIALFFTRFITHFCAPAFMLLSGTSAFLVGQRKGKRHLSYFLLTRGLWLVALELTVVNFGWFFDIGFSNIGTLVIWALGVSMILLAGLVHLPTVAIAAISLTMIFGHNLLDGVQFTGAFSKYLWAVLHTPNVFPFEGFTWFALYPLIPWVGVMALGYCLGTWYVSSYNPSLRKRLLMVAGISCILFFIALRFSNFYGDPFPWSTLSSWSFTLLSFLSLNKYPPSLLYLLITLGPLLMALAVTENTSNAFSRRIQVIGRVPMFYYIVHIYLIHLAAMLLAQLTPGLSWKDLLLKTWVSFSPALRQGYGLNLAGTYAVWIGLVAVLYLVCKQYDRYKRTHRHWWLSYL